jgi:CopG family nickel-responsive transcriptional regulator
MESIVRFGVSIEPELLSQFDTIIKEKGYTNRSEALRDLIRKAIVDRQSLDPEADALGTLTMVYDHHIGSLAQRLLELQHAPAHRSSPLPGGVGPEGKNQGDPRIG